MDRPFSRSVGTLILAVMLSTSSPPLRAEGAKRTHTYKTVGKLAIKADVYRESDARKRPVVVWIHGGALINGHREAVPQRLKDACRKAGHVLVSIDYRLAPETQLPGIIADLEDALKWVHDEGPKLFHADPDRVAVVGGSAGGYLTLAAGHRARPRPVALVSFWGYGDLVGPWYSRPSPHPRHNTPKVSREKAMEQVRGAPVADARDRKGDGGAFYLYCRQTGAWPRAVTGWDPDNEADRFAPFMPLKNVTRDYPPTLLVHGEDDTDVPYEQSRLMAAELKRQGVEHRLIGIPKGEHGLQGGDQKEIDAAYEAAFAFLRRHLDRAPHPDTATLRNIAKIAGGGRLGADAAKQIRSLIAGLTDAKVRTDMEKLVPALEEASARHARDRVLLAEIKRLGGKVTLESDTPAWLRSIAGDEHLPVFGRIVEIELNERTDGHKAPDPKKLSDRVTDDWLERLAGQDRLVWLELSGTAITSAGLIHLKELKTLRILNICLTAVDDRGFEHLAGMTDMRRMVICASKITGTGFAHLRGMKRLESINLHSSPASDAGLEAIGKLTSLKRLEIVHTNVTDAGLKHLAGLTRLRQLHIHGPKTTAAALPFLGELKELDQLDVYDRAASNQTLEQIGKLPKLRLLTLPEGVHDDEGVKHLAGLMTLEELSLDSAKVTDASVASLAGLKNLRKLHLGRCRISDDGKKRLQALLPKVAIAP
jgi:acetyl esterase/lipase